MTGKTKSKASNAAVAAMTAAEAITNYDKKSWSGYVTMVHTMATEYRSLTTKAQQDGHNKKVAKHSGKSVSWVDVRNGEGNWVIALVTLGYEVEAIQALSLRPTYFNESKGTNRLLALIKAETVVPTNLTIAWLKKVKGWDVTKEAAKIAKNKRAVDTPPAKRKSTMPAGKQGKDLSELKAALDLLSPADLSLVFGWTSAKLQNNPKAFLACDEAQLDNMASSTTQNQFQIKAQLVVIKAESVTAS
jgi:hypothetical protein